MVGDFLRDPLILLLEVRRRRDVTGPFLREGLDLVVELLDPDLRVRSRLLLRLQHFIKLAQLGVEQCQRRALLLKTTLSLSDEL